MTLLRVSKDCNGEVTSPQIESYDLGEKIAAKKSSLPQFQHESRWSAIENQVCPRCGLPNVFDWESKTVCLYCGYKL